MFTFDPESDALKPMSRRKVTITAPAQMLRGARRKLVVEAQPLPSLGELKIPANKGIEKLLVLVIDDRVRDAETRDEVYEFEKPLTYVIEYTKEDIAATTLNADGTPRLSIVTGYQTQDGWKFERLPTKVTPNPKTGGGTLTAQVKTLQPLDPKWISIP
ncbi:MAG: hypothetical protein DCC52_12225 [Chloroflexi bacterium]|nr:MAG: hypothetical protein DCC52_12225 [Chloroflexota bacterium]